MPSNEDRLTQSDQPLPLDEEVTLSKEALAAMQEELDRLRSERDALQVRNKHLAARPATPAQAEAWAAKAFEELRNQCNRTVIGSLHGIHPDTLDIAIDRNGESTPVAWIPVPLWPRAVKGSFSTRDGHSRSKYTVGETSVIRSHAHHTVATKSGNSSSFTLRAFASVTLNTQDPVTVSEALNASWVASLPPGEEESHEPPFIPSQANEPQS